MGGTVIAETLDNLHKPCDKQVNNCYSNWCIQGDSGEKAKFLGT